MRAQAGADLQQSLSQSPKLAGLLTTAAPVPATAATMAQGQMRVAGQETDAGESCDALVLTAGKEVKICYCLAMHIYPGTVPRSIILKSARGIGADENTFQAKVFEHSARTDLRVFAPPADIRLRDISARR